MDTFAPDAMLKAAESAVESVEDMFCDGIGAAPAHYKGRGDFATEVDVGIEKRLRKSLISGTGIPVLGEEHTAPGEGNPVNAEAMWVVDPIDGTANYSAGSPLCGILVALLYHGRPAVAVVSFPLLNRRMVATREGVYRVTGLWAQPKSSTANTHNLGVNEARDHVGCSSQLPLELLGGLAHDGLRPRMTGSVGLDSAFVSHGIFGGAINFSPHPWDNAAGALLVTAAGGVATDPAGNEWAASARGLITGTRRVHGMLTTAVDRVR